MATVNQHDFVIDMELLLDHRAKLANYDIKDRHNTVFYNLFKARECSHGLTYIRLSRLSRLPLLNKMYE